MIQTGIQCALEPALLSWDKLQQNNAKTLSLHYSLLGKHFDLSHQIRTKLKIRRRISLINKLQSLIDRFSECTGFKVDFVTRFYGHYRDERLRPFLEGMPHTE